MIEPKDFYVIVGVKDFQTSLAFFRDTVGFPLAFSDESFHYAAFVVAGRNFSIVVDTSPDAPPFAPRHTGVGFMVEDVDAAYEALKAKGVEFTMPPAKQPWGGYMGLFKDPDGNTYYLDQAQHA